MGTKGKHVGILLWPFKKSATFILYNYIQLL